MITKASISRHQRMLIVAALLGLTTSFLFWPATQNEFIVYDDHDYVTGNAMVQKGMKWETVAWAFTTGHAANWHPLTWLSHALDCELFGLKPAGHHQTSIVLHALNAGLLMGLLWQLTGRLGRSAMVAAVFAWHPLRVESVAWVAERKDVLCAFFGLLALLAYARYAQLKIRNGKSESVERLSTPHPALSPVAAERVKFARWSYGLALLFFALGLMSKPMLVTLPLVMLLLDFWPLNRVPRAEFRVSSWKPLVMEKVPFLALVIASCIATYAAQKAGGAVREFGIASRLANIPVAYLQYLKKFLLPMDLAVIYPFKPVAASAGVLAAILLAGVCVAAWRGARTRGYVFTGWFWFAGMLVPVIGVIQVGYQAFADRYTYLPAIGLSMALVWGTMAACDHWRLPRALPMVAGAAVLGILPWLTRDYLRHWKNTTDLFEHAVSVTGPHTIALKNMGLAYMERGELEKSRTCFEQSLAIEPGDQPTLFNLGSVLLQQQKSEEALRYLNQLKAARVQQHEAAAYAKVAIMLGEQRQTEDAAVFYQKALEGDAQQLDALNNLAWLRATAADAQLRNGGEAVLLAERACQLTEQRVPILLGTLAAAYAEAGRFAEAIATAEKARDLARAKQQEGIARSNERLLESYRAGKPARETP